MQAGTSNAVANFSYLFDTIGNLVQRQDFNQPGTLTEHFCYDVLDRLTGYKLTTSTTCPQSGGTTVAYNDIGNITSKSDVGTYSYPAPGAARPHAISSKIG